jgi:NhaA family Na+:H+ antiporter
MRLPAHLDPVVEPIDETIDHLWGPTSAPLVLMYGDYECPESRYTFRELQRAERELGSAVRIAFRHFPRQHLHPRSLAAAAAVEAAALQDAFWEMHYRVFHRHWALEERDLRRYAADLGLHLPRFHLDRFSPEVLARIGRDVATGLASGEVRETPTLFIDGAVYRGRHAAASLLAALAS